jgi:epoxide hydrolase-like predicted phosphatase
MIKAVIFDYGGVILKSPRCIESIARVYKVPKEVVAKKMRPILDLFQKGVITENKFWQKLSLVLRKPIPNKKDLWRECIEKDFHIYPEMRRFVKKIRSQGIKTAVLSNIIKPHIGVIKKHLGYKDFDDVILSCRIGMKKPEPRIYLLTVKRLKVKPKECIFIDDRNKFLKPAKRLGIKTILARNPKQVIHDVYNILG